MRILHIGVMIGGGFSKALKKRAEVVEVPSGKPELIPLDQSFDLAFIQVQNETMGNRRSLEVLRPVCDKYFTVNWSGDMRASTPSWMLQLPSDVVAFSNYKDVNAARTHGRRAEFLQIGIDPEIFNPHGPVSPSPEIVFFGNDYGNIFPLGGFRRDAVRHLKARYGKRFGLYGNYQGADGNYNVQGDPDEWQNKEAAIYRGSKIALSMSHFQADGYTSDRLLRAMGCGCLVLAHLYPNSGFENEVVFFNGLSDLTAKIDKWLDQDATELKRKAAERIAKDFTFDAMVENIIKMK